jgi:hypothetical protein
MKTGDWRRRVDTQRGGEIVIDLTAGAFSRPEDPISWCGRRGSAAVEAACYLLPPELPLDALIPPPLVLLASALSAVWPS